MISLPQPFAGETGSLKNALAQRRSCREFSEEPMTLEELATVLWAANGCTDEEGRRTAPMAYGSDSLVLLVAVLHVHGVEPGLYRYVSRDPDSHHLLNDIPGFNFEAISPDVADLSEIENPAALVIVANDPKLAVKSNGESTEEWAPINAALAIENLLITATASGLGAVMMGDIDPEKLATLTDPNLVPQFVVSIGRLL